MTDENFESEAKLKAYYIASTESTLQEAEEALLSKEDVEKIASVEGAGPSFRSTEAKRKSLEGESKTEPVLRTPKEDVIFHFSKFKVALNYYLRLEFNRIKSQVKTSTKRFQTRYLGFTVPKVSPLPPNQITVQVEVDSNGNPKPRNLQEVAKNDKNLRNKKRP